jgi:hypothetical protein
MTIFEVLWYSGGTPHAPNRVIGRDFIKRHDLTDATKRACSLFLSGQGEDDGYAHGFYVRRAEDQSTKPTTR